MNRLEDMKDVVNRINGTTAPATQNTSKPKLQSSDMAKQLIDKYHIIRLNNSQIYIYEKSEGIYVSNDYERLNDYIYADFPLTSYNQCRDIRHKIQHTAPIVKHIAPPNYIAFNNRHFRFES